MGVAVRKGCNKRMNINFIRNLSDEILRENQQLKTDIIALRQRLADYEEEMTQTMTPFAPNPSLASPRHTLTAFIGAFKQLLSERQTLTVTANQKITECRALRLKVEALEKECINAKIQIEAGRKREQQLREETKETSGRFQGEREQLRSGQEQLSRELIQLKEQLRLERIMMAETKRREVEEVRQYHLKELLEFREKADREVVEVEKQLRAELAERDNTIKHLQKALEKLSYNLKLDQKESDILVKLLRSFQEHSHLTRTVQERSQEVSRFRQQLQEMDMARIKAESRLKEITVNEAHLHSQIDRLSIAKSQLQDKLASQRQSLEKSQQDKDAMEKYYDHKWNKEYSKVKQQLEKAFNERLAAVESQCAQTVEDLRSTTHKAQEELAVTLLLNQQLTNTANLKEQQWADSQKRQQYLQEKMEELLRERREGESMLKEELFQRQFSHQQEINCFENQIQSLNKLLSVEKEIYGDLQGQHARELQEAAQIHRQEIERVLSEKARERKVLEHQHEKEVRALHQQLAQKERFIEDARNNLAREIEQQAQKRREAAVVELQARTREKEEEIAKKNDKWMSKYKELDLRYTALKKRHEDDQEASKKEITRLETLCQNLSSSERKLHAEVKDSLVLKNDLLIRIGELENKINILNVEAEEAAEQRKELEKNMKEKNGDIIEWKNARASWLGELEALQKGYKTQFQHLKKLHQKQTNLLRSKLWEVEELARKRPIRRSDYERLQQMERERKQLRNEVYIKEAENIILNQVKDYYQTKLREEERPPPEEAQAGTALMGYKLRMLKRSAQKQGLHQQSQLDESKEVTEMRKYIVKSTKRSMKLSLSKIRSEDVARYHRLNTAYD